MAHYLKYSGTLSRIAVSAKQHEIKCKQSSHSSEDTNMFAEYICTTVCVCVCVDFYQACVK